MPILRKKSSRKAGIENKNDNLIADVTIGDFANSSRTHARFKKAVTNICSEVKQEGKYFSSKMDNGTDQIAVICTDKVKKPGKGTSTNHRKNEKAKPSEKDSIEKESEGIDYPLDLWFSISEYISPETVGKFARICRSSYHVTRTAKFWFHLYKSYYRFVPTIPERLQPQCMVRTHGLRACVIRTLHYTYFPLHRGLEDVFYLRQNMPYSLVRRKCCLIWHKNTKKRWYYYFSLKKVPKSTSRSIKQKLQVNSKKTDFLEMLEDVAVNPEEGYKVLRVTCLTSSLLPPVIGLFLQSVLMTLMPGLIGHKLQLGFGTTETPNTCMNQVILNSVVSCKILDWWHPSYPHQDSVFTIELPQSDVWDQSLL